MTTIKSKEISREGGLEDTKAGLKGQVIACGQDDIQTEINYLIKDSKHDIEKPYDIRYDTGGAIPTTNMANDSKPILIRNFRPIQNSQSFEEYGFTSAKIDCALTAAEIADDKRVAEVFYPAIEKLLHQKFPQAAEIRILEHCVRKRDPQFPSDTDPVFAEFAQPAIVVHLDVSPQSVDRTARLAFKREPNQYQRLLVINLWKSFQGPGNDWPLALCDSRTLDHNLETIAVDVVYPNRFTENKRVYHNPNHEWYYFKDLGDDEIIMFQQLDSDFEGGRGVAHTSFYNSQADKNAALRTSIELRTFIYFI